MNEFIFNNVTLENNYPYENDKYLYFNLEANLYVKIRRLLSDKKIGLVLKSEKYIPFSFWKNKEVVVYKALLYEFYLALKIAEQVTSVYYNKGKLKEIISWIENESSLSIIFNEENNFLDLSRIDKLMVFKPLDHQRLIYANYGKAKSMGMEGFILSASVGSGKTFMSLSIAESTPKIDKVIVIAPLETLDDVWVSAFDGELYKRKQDYYHFKMNKSYNGERYIICHFQALDKLKSILPDITGNKFIIVDEIQNFAAHKSDRTKLLKEVFEDSKSENKILMSGTPVKGSLSELTNLLNMLSTNKPKRIKDKLTEFYHRPNAVIKYILKQKYDLNTTIILKDEFELPDITTVKLEVSFDGADKYKLSNVREKVRDYVKMRMLYFKEHKKEYDARYLDLYKKAKEILLSQGHPESDFSNYERLIKLIVLAHDKRRLMDFSSEIEEANLFERKIILPVLQGHEKKEFRSTKSVFKYLTLKIQGESLSLVIGKMREEAHIDMLTHIDLEQVIESSNSSTIIFSKYVNVCLKVKLMTDMLGYNSANVYGDNTKMLSSQVKDFQDGKLNPMIATYQSLSTGVRLTKASAMLLVDAPFKAYMLNQAIARMHRIGQLHPCILYYAELYTDGEANINTRNINLVEINNAVIEELTGVTLGGLEEKEETDEIGDILEGMEEKGVNRILNKFSNKITIQIKDNLVRFND